MPEMGTMQQINSEPLRTATVLTPQSQAEQYAREAQQAAAEAAQSATDAQTAAASAEQAVAGAVKYSEAQTLTAAQQAQARENIGAGDAEEVAELKSAIDDIATHGQSYNLLDPSKFTIGVLNSNNGSINPNYTTRYTSDWIPVKAGSKYYFTDVANGVFSGYTKNHIVRYWYYTNKNESDYIPDLTGNYVGYTDIAPQNAMYLRVSFSSAFYIENEETYPCLTQDDYPVNTSQIKRYNPDEEKYSLLIEQTVNDNANKIERSFRYNQCVNTIAHRGYSVDVPECTKWAYIAAKANGFKTVENDVNASSNDNRVLFMWHDSNFKRCGDIYDADNGYALYTDGTNYYWYDEEHNILYDVEYETASGISIDNLSRVNGENLVCLTTSWDIIKNIDVGRYRGDSFKGTKVLTFNEWVLLCKQLGLDIYIDRKINIEYFINEMVGYVKQLGMLDHATWVINVTASIGESIRTLDPNARLALITRPTSEQLPAIAALASSGRGVVYDLANTLTTSETVAEAINNGIIPEAYYVNYGNNVSETEIFAEIRRLVELGCTSLTLDTYFVNDAYQYMYEELNNRIHDA